MDSRSECKINSIAILGVGLIGGSFAKSFKKIGINLIGYDKDLGTLKDATASGIFNLLTDDLDIILSSSPDLIYISLPINATLDMLDLLAKKGVTTLITDAASTKSKICDRAKSLGLNFIGGHPVAGKEVSGFRYSDASILLSAKHILIESDNKEMLELLTSLHTAIGMRIDILSAEKHDNIFAEISHLPHLIAFALIDSVQKNSRDSFDYISAGFKDFTRIAASDDLMWTDIFIDNKKALIKSTNYLQSIISHWSKMIEEEDYAKLRSEIKTISDIRRGLK